MAFGSQAITTYLLGKPQQQLVERVSWECCTFDAFCCLDEIAVNSRLVGSRGPSPSPSTSSRRSSPLRHRPANAVVFDGVLPWAATAAAGLRIPRYAFTGMGCFALSVQRALLLHAPQDGVASDDEPFLVPGLPDVVRLFRPQPPEPCLRRREPLSLRRERGDRERELKVREMGREEEEGG
ncbi:abscisate beta-glucosyltransferase-like [Oryza glaberrima]|uniref:abscisate beta-glucosyltransferase-like n=1 Tax=Oryza glaberrima TaxID=4538 RepID=UPI00224C10CD|nr:abscisate beta-glucosyltransferase-like [Oryza glaberrima]